MCIDRFDKSIDIFPWDDNFNTGLDDVDRQHRKLVRLLNALASHVAFSKDESGLGEVFDELASYAVYHIETEELIWHEYLADDPAEAAHRATHAGFVQKVGRFRAGVTDLAQHDVAEEALDFLVHWLASHILESDRAMAYTVLAMRAGHTREAAKLEAQQRMSGSTRTLIGIILSIYSTLTSNTLRLMNELASRRHMEDLLRQETVAKRALLRHASDGIHILDTNGNVVEASDAFAAMLGYQPDEVIGMNVADWDAGFNPAKLPEMLRQQLLTPARSEFETRHRRKDGTVFDVEVSGYPLEIDGRVLLFNSSRDITERKQAEAAVQQQAAFVAAIVDSQIDGIAVSHAIDTAPHIHFTIWNPAMSALTGYSVDDVNRLGWYQTVYVDPGVQEPARQRMERMRLGEHIQGEEWTITRKDGVRRIVEVHTRDVAPPGGGTQVMALMRDVTERKRAEESLRLREHYQRALLDNFPFMVWLKDTDSNFLAVNQAYADACGHASPTDLTGKSDLDLWPEALAAGYRTDDMAVLNSGQPKHVEEELLVNGQTTWIETYKSPVVVDGQTLGTVGFARDITERKQAEADLLHEKQFSEDILNALPGVFYMFDEAGRFLRWNRQFSRIMGYTDAELARMRATDFFAGDDQRRVGEAMQRVFTDGQADVEADFLTHDGRLVPYYFTGMRCTLGNRTYMLGVGMDVSELHRTQQALETERVHLHTLVSAIPDLIWLKDPEGVYLSCNPAFERFFGAAERDIVGKTDHDFVSRELADFFRQNDLAAMAAGKPTRNEESITYASDSRRVHLETTKVPLRTPGGQLVGVLGIGHDITERKAHQKQLEHIAHFDILTGLPNRSLLADRLQLALAQSLRRKTTLAVAYLDLDGFKAINDRHGHDTGDHLLTALSGHMKRALREGDTLARLGGDEFVAILLDLPNIESSVPMLSRLLAAAGEVVYENGNALRVSASLGVTFFPQVEPIDADQLLRQADQAMYQAKQMGKNRFHIFDAEHDRSVRGHRESLERIEQALHQREFVLHYQPKVNMRTGKVVGAEALIRWQHPERGLLPPGAFLPLVANHPLAIQIGEWVLATAMSQIERWKAVGLSLPVSVNIDAIQLEQADFVDRLQQQLAAHPALVPGDLELEVLETSALDDMAKVSVVMLACRKMGVGFALDDFGTGYSSLTYLKRLPAGLLKIDQSFVRDMLDDPDDLSILEGVLGLSKAFQRRVIAEGVETLAHGEMLLRLGCELAQGYAIARPMSAQAIPDWLATWRPNASWLNQVPISRDDLPVLFASVEHRVWINRVVSFIRGEGDALPPMDHEQCRVGQWMTTEAHTDRHLAINALRPLHTDIHRLANDLVQLKHNGEGEVALARVDELHGLRDQLLARFAAMLQ